MISLRVLGSPSIVIGDDTPLTGRAAQPRRLALLALLAIAGERGVSREKLIGYLWPERDADRARQLLNQGVYSVRKALGGDAVISTATDLRLDPQHVDADVARFEAALERGDYVAAVAQYHGPFLDGFFLSGTPEFERWTDQQRARLAGDYAGALESLADLAARSGDTDRAVHWWRMRAAHDPLDSHVALRLMEALDATGNRAGALQHATIHERLVREELGVNPVPVRTLADRLRGERAAWSAQDAAQPTSTRPGAIAAVSRSLPNMKTPHGRGHSIARYAAAALTAAGIAGVALFMVLPRGHAYSSTAAAAAGRPASRNIAAYELYVRANDRTKLRSDSAARQAVELFRQALALDSTYAAAWAGLARMYVREAAGSRDAARYFALAERAARRAVALEDSLAEAHATLGGIRMSAFDFVEAEKELSSAIELDPRSTLAHQWMVSLALWTGRPHDALAHARRAVELDPLSPEARAELARALLGNGRCDEALANLDSLTALTPPLLRVAPMKAECFVRAHMWPNALVALREQADHGEPIALAQLGYSYARSGRPDHAARIRQSLLERWRRGEVGAFAIALVSAGLGDQAATFDWLNRAIADRSLAGTPGNPALSLVTGPLFAEVRDDPRFESLRNRLGLSTGSRVSVAGLSVPLLSHAGALGGE